MSPTTESLYEELRQLTDGGSESMTHDDALRQIEDWRETIGAQAAEIESLRSEVAALKADAERYRWLRAQQWQENKLGVVLRPKDNTHLGTFIPSLKLLDDAIDHMSKEQQ